MPLTAKREEDSAPLISVVLPTFNGARYIREAIDSCFAQTLSDFELIVVVDGSTDETDEILRSYDDPRMRVLKTENRGQAPAMNTGFEIARGRYWTWTSDDNVYLERAFEVMARYLDDHPEAIAVSTDSLVIDAVGRTISYQETAWQCFLYRREAAASAGPHRPEARILEDVDFYCRLKHFAGPVHRIRRPYYKYRVHAGSVSYRMAGERQLVSLKLNYDLITRGIINFSLEEVFFDRLSRAALYRDEQSMEAILEFAREKGMRFVTELEAEKNKLLTPTGWIVNRARIAMSSQWVGFRARTKLLHYLLTAGRHND